MLASESNTARGSGLAEQVKKLEASKRRVKEKLPKVTETLRAQLADWLATEGTPVRHDNAVPYSEILEVRIH